MDEWGDSLEAKPAAGTAGAGKNPSPVPPRRRNRLRKAPLPVRPLTPLWSLPLRPRVPNTLCWSSPSLKPTAIVWERTAWNSITFSAKPGAASTASQAGPVLFISGAAGASVYASAVAASVTPTTSRSPATWAWSSNSIPDAKAASARAALRAQLAPQQAMPALNLAWGLLQLRPRR